MVVQNLVYLFKSKEAWFILRNNTLTIREFDGNSINCFYNSVKLTSFIHEDKLHQLFIHIPALQKTHFLSYFEYPDLLENFDSKLRKMKELNNNLSHKFK
jgi:hypothetical protein